MAKNIMEKYKVPSGLRPLLEAMARETLRAQPSDLYQFGQLFFEVLQQHRLQNPNLDVISDPLSYDVFCTELHHKYNSQQQEPSNAPPSDSNSAELAATKIQAAYRGHAMRKHLEKKRNSVDRPTSFSRAS